MTSDEASLQHLASFMTFTWNNFDVNDWIIVESGSISPKRKDISMLQTGLCLTIFVTFLNLQYGTRALYAFGLVCGNVKVVLILASVLSCLFFLLLHNFCCHFLCVIGRHNIFGESLGRHWDAARRNLTAGLWRHLPAWAFRKSINTSTFTWSDGHTIDKHVIPTKDTTMTHFLHHLWIVADGTVNFTRKYTLYLHYA